MTEGPDRPDRGLSTDPGGLSTDPGGQARVHQGGQYSQDQGGQLREAGIRHGEVTQWRMHCIRLGSIILSDQ